VPETNSLSAQSRWGRQNIHGFEQMFHEYLNVFSVVECSINIGYAKLRSGVYMLVKSSVSLWIFCLQTQGRGWDVSQD
jgi:hypothetical protein